MLNYTQGPWWVDDGFIVSANATIADPHASDIDPDDRDANAGLIAAAPALYEALGAVVLEYPDGASSPALAQALAALTLADGINRR